MEPRRDETARTDTTRAAQPAQAARASRRSSDADAAAAAPSDRTTLTEVIDAYRDSGFATDFFAEETAGEPRTGGSDDGAGVGVPTVRCERCASTLDPRRLTIHSMRRLEGASDPADMVAIVATTCPVCGSDGTLVLSYGPMASAVDADVLVLLKDRRGDDVLPAGVAPGERDTVG
jgi:hypothetical protein